MRSEVRVRILGNLYSRIRDLYSNVNGILSIDGRINKEIKLDTRIVSKVLRKPRIE